MNNKCTYCGSIIEEGTTCECEKNMTRKRNLLEEADNLTIRDINYILSLTDFQAIYDKKDSMATRTYLAYKYGYLMGRESMQQSQEV